MSYVHVSRRDLFISFRVLSGHVKHRVIYNNTLRRDDNKVNEAEVRICGAKGGNATMGVMALMDARLRERYAIITNYHRYCISDSVLAMTDILFSPHLNTALLKYLLIIGKS